jgi:hypothetical protein
MSQFGVHWVTARLCSFELRRRSVSFIEVVEAANIAPVVVTVRCLGSAEFERLSGGSRRLSSQQKCSRPTVARAQFVEWAVMERPLLYRKAADVWWMRRAGQTIGNHQVRTKRPPLWVRRRSFVPIGTAHQQIGQLTYCRKAIRNGNSALPSGLEFPEPPGGRVMTHDLKIGFRTSAVDPAGVAPASTNRAA